MFIRKTQTCNSSTGEKFFTFRLVRGERIGGKVRQITVLNLGRNFTIKQDDWPTLCRRIEQLLTPQDSFLAIDCPVLVERAAQRYAGLLVVRAQELAAPPPEAMRLASLFLQSPQNRMPPHNIIQIFNMLM